MAPVLGRVIQSFIPLVDLAGAIIEKISTLNPFLLGTVSTFLLLKRAGGNTFTTLKTGFETLALKALYAKDAVTTGATSMMTGVSGLSGALTRSVGVLGRVRTAATLAGGALKAAFLSNPIGVALTAISGALMYFSNRQQEAKNRAQELKNTLDQTTGALTRNTVEWLKSDEKISSAARAYEKAGGKIQDFYASLRGDTQALERYNQILEENQGKFDASLGYGAGIKVVDQFNQVHKETSSILKEAEQAILANQAAALSEAQAIYHTADANRDNLLTMKELDDYRAGRANAFGNAIKQEIAQKRLIEEATKALSDKTVVTDEERLTLIQLAEQIRSTSRAYDEAGRGQKALVEHMGQARTQFLDLAQAAGLSAQEAGSLADELGLIPESVKASVDLDAQDARMELGTLIGQINKETGTVNIDGKTVEADMKLADLLGRTADSKGTISFLGNPVPADMTLSEVIQKINLSKGSLTVDGNSAPAQQIISDTLKAIREGREWVSIDGNPTPVNDVLTALNTRVKKEIMKVPIGADTSMFFTSLGKLINTRLPVKGMPIVGAPASMQKDGSVLRFYANGGVENHVAQIAPAGAYRIWAEKETGGEAYIPLAERKRARSTQILRQVANEFGYMLQPKIQSYSNGGFAPVKHTPTVNRGGTSLILEVDGKAFPAYLREVAAQTASSLPGVQAVNNFVQSGHYRAMIGV